ncbi:MAG: bifunctional (p)ppGpp synthetase/guanosine-3',5'-bis(diphosphate) 3'-pyrophosphohydrolase [Chthonomonadales bacterium]|nr:bifunctional (p)ppGpp synthetase/guanosine-3',5'-bis(diphosphate) 3'-pyrophosphohydrolase [Chthonomonadales bacterium]
MLPPREPPATRAVIEQRLETLLRSVAEHRPDVSLDRVRAAFQFADQKHDGQLRKTGDPFITHPLAVAQILAELQMDEATIMAALLHDTVEDCGVKLEDIELRFGAEVAGLVDGVTSLKSIGRDVFSDEPIPGQSPPVSEAGGSGEPERAAPAPSPDDGAAATRAARRRSVAKRAANLRRLLMAMARDLRVVIIKLADRLHNMRTLWAMPADHQLRTALETEQVFAPLAHRVGIWQMKWELEDLAFAYAYPKEYERVAAMVAQTRAERQSEVDEAVRILSDTLAREGLPDAHVTGRPKHLYSIWVKMQQQALDFDDIYDLVALRVIVHTRQQCYQALGIVSSIWPPIPTMYSDYIAKAKTNLYQSIHVKVIGPHNKPVEVQIRTWDMHRTAEFGVAAHWAYKEHGEGAKAQEVFDRRMSWLRRQLFEWPLDAPDSGTFLRQVAQNLFSDQVFVFTPKGDVMDLPAGATIIDFAYRIHSDVGNRAIGARVNGKYVPLAHTLRNGDIVEVVTRANSTPGRDWLTLARTAHARSKIKAYFRRVMLDENIERGRAILQREAERVGIERSALRDEALAAIAQTLNLRNEVDLYAALGYGSLSVVTVLKRLAPDRELPDRDTMLERRGRSDDRHLRVTVGGLDNVSFRRSRCCMPIPEDHVVGYVTRNAGLALHRRECPNAQHLMETEPDRVMPVDYSGNPGQVFSVPLRIRAADRKGLIGDIGDAFAEAGIMITKVNTRSHRDNTATIDLCAEIRDLEQIARIEAGLQRMPDIISIERTMGGAHH